MSPADLWLSALGHLHPILLHFPLALGVVAALVECARWVRTRAAPSPVAFAILWFAAIIAPIVALSGWFLADEQVDDSWILWIHRWTGIGSAALLLFAAILATAAKRAAQRAAVAATTSAATNAAPGAAPSTTSGTASIAAVPAPRGVAFGYRFVLIVTAITLGYCGHLGGEMKWGEGFTTGKIFDAIRAAFGGAVPRDTGDAPAAPSPADRERLKALTAVEHVTFTPSVQEIFEAHCASCHLGGRRKGRLSLASVDSIVRENEDGAWIVKAGEPEESELFRRISLPAGSADQMPPKGPRLDPIEIAAIQRWIKEGAK